MAPLRYTAKFDPFLSLDCPPPWRNPRKGRDQILPSGNTGKISYRRHGCCVFVRDENVGQVEDAAEHDEADAVRDGGGHSEEIPKAVPFQQFALLQHLLLKCSTSLFFQVGVSNGYYPYSNPDLLEFRESNSTMYF